MTAWNVSSIVSARHDDVVIAASEVEDSKLRSVEVLRRDGKQQLFSARQELRTRMRDLSLCLVECCQWLWFTATCRHAQQALRTGKNDRVIITPVRAGIEITVAQDHRRAAGSRNFKDLGL